MEFGDFRNLRPPRPATLVFTDPPYNLGHNYGPVSDKLHPYDYYHLLMDLSKWAATNTQDDAYLAILHRPEIFFRWGVEIMEAGNWQYVQQIRWCYNSNTGHSYSKFTTSSREILLLSKGRPAFYPKADPMPYENPTDRRIKRLVDNGSPGRAPYDWWVINLQKNVGRDYAGYSNQLPVPLISRLVLSCTKLGDLVADPFGGTGSLERTAVALGREGWSCDLNPGAPGFTA